MLNLENMFNLDNFIVEKMLLSTVEKCCIQFSSGRAK